MSRRSPGEPKGDVPDDPNERIQQALHERQAQKVWPGEWRGRAHAAAQAAAEE